jgi:hypothetical protein
VIEVSDSPENPITRSGFKDKSISKSGFIPSPTEGRLRISGVAISNSVLPTRLFPRSIDRSVSVAEGTSDIIRFGAEINW